MSKDPIFEKGGNNLYSFCDNDINSIDYQGLHCLPCVSIRDAELFISDTTYEGDIKLCGAFYDERVKGINDVFNKAIRDLDNAKTKCYNDAVNRCLGIRTCEDAYKTTCDFYYRFFRGKAILVRDVAIITIAIQYDDCKIQAKIRQLNRNAIIWSLYGICIAGYGTDDNNCPCQVQR